MTDKEKKAIEETKKNRVYCAEGDPDYGCQYIAARTVKDAKQIAMGCDISQHLDNPYIELRVTWCKNAGETDFEGELDIDQINQLGLAWWDCPKCGNEEFEILDDYHYMCKNCREENEIPYVNH